jgi:hypothetical protein
MGSGPGEAAIGYLRRAAAQFKEISCPLDEPKPRSRHGAILNVVYSSRMRAQCEGFTIAA